MSADENLKKSTHYGRKRVGIFGGSFDPIHDGHIHLANLAKDAAELDEVWFLPCRISPHKAGRPPSDGEVRIKWLGAAIRDLPWAKIESCELDSEGPSYSYKTMQNLTEKYPRIEWFWIMGGDQWAALPTWKYPEVIAELVTFIVLARNGDKIVPRPGYRLQVVVGEHPASATEIRRALAAGEEDVAHLNPAVMEMLCKPD